jgi:hypothetical protein
MNTWEWFFCRRHCEPELVLSCQDSDIKSLFSCVVSQKRTLIGDGPSACVAVLAGGKIMVREKKLAVKHADTRCILIALCCSAL